MSPQSLGIAVGSEEEAHKLRLSVAEMRRDAALLEQRVRAAEVHARLDTNCPNMFLAHLANLPPPPPLPPPPYTKAARRVAEEKFHEKNDQVVGLQNEVTSDFFRLLVLSNTAFFPAVFFVFAAFRPSRKFEICQRRGDQRLG